MFRDEFDSLANWSVYDSVGHNGEGRRTPDNVYVSQGSLVIYGNASGYTGGLKLRGPVQQYGRWSVRLKAPEGAGVYHPVALLWGVGSGSAVNAVTGEIDFVEFWNRPDRDVSSVSLHYGDGSQVVGASVAVTGPEWHTYSVLWTPGRIVTFVDDVQTWATTDTSKFPQNAVELCLQLDWFPHEPTTSGASVMVVDWVEVQTLAETGYPDQRVTTTSTTPKTVIAQPKPVRKRWWQR